MRLAVVLALATSALGARFYDRPDKKATGGVTAAVQPIAQLEAVVVVEPVTRRVYEAAIDRKAGVFRMQGLPPGKYDLVLKFRDVVAEGLRLDVPGGFQPLSKEDRAGVEKVVWQSEDFFNEKTIARMGGNGRYVRLFVEQVRDRKTYDPGGAVLKNQLVRRFDLTWMRKAGQLWQIHRNRHLFRERRDMSRPGRTLRFLHVPALGGIRVGEEMVRRPPIQLKTLRDRRATHFYTAAKKIK